MDNYIELDLRATYPRVAARRIWQVLFNYYKEHGADLAKLDNLLIDYDNCKRMLDGDKSPTFLWSCDTNWYGTQWSEESSWHPSSAETVARLMNGSLVVFCKYQETSMIFTVVRKDSL